MKYSMVFAATAALFTSTSAKSTFAVVNRCNIDLYLWSVGGGQSASQMFTLPANTPNIGYSETYRYVSQYAGVSIKVAPYYLDNGLVPPQGFNVTQLEYTVPPPQNNDPNIYYDLSMVNGNALMGIPFTYSPSSPGGNCKAGSCSGDYATCFAGYNGAHDDDNTHACLYEQDIIFTFCDGNPQQPLLKTPGQYTCDNTGCHPVSNVKAREVAPESQPDPDAVCVSAEAAQAGAGVPVFAGLCPQAAPVAPAPAPVPTTSSSSSSSVVAPTQSAVAALQQPAQAPTTTSSSSSAAPVATQAAAPAAGPPTSPLSQLQLSSLANTGVTCWQSFETGNTCGVSARSVPEKRSVHAHGVHHNHMAFHRRNRIIRSA